MIHRDSMHGLALIGYRGTGKSTVGRIVAARAGRPFLDADAAIEARVGRPIREIFARRGEEAFRDAEEEALRALTAGPGAVLATGGGAILRAANREALRRYGFVAWLTAPPAVLAGRIAADRANERPALTAAGPLAEIAGVLALREPFYRATADAVIDTADRNAEDVADEVLGRWIAWTGRRAVGGESSP